MAAAATHIAAAASTHTRPIDTSPCPRTRVSDQMIVGGKPKGVNSKTAKFGQKLPEIRLFRTYLMVSVKKAGRLGLVALRISTIARLSARLRRV